MSVYFFNLLSNGIYPYLLIVAAFWNKSFSSKTSSLVENSYLPTFSDDNAKILAVYLAKVN